LARNPHDPGGTVRRKRGTGADARFGGTETGISRGVLVEALNPKTAAFFLAFVPQFVDPAGGSVALQFVVLGFVSVALNTLADVVVAYAAAGIRAGAAVRPHLVHRLRQASGGAMIALGIGLAVARRPAA
jgi:threonine/homoserine/homoserine lactone efflux protein